MTGLGELLSVCVDRRLDGAACTGMGHIFEGRREYEPTCEHRERVEKAQHICDTCPVIDNCADVAAGLPRRHKTGVWAGTYYDDQGRPWATKEN